MLFEEKSKGIERNNDTTQETTTVEERSKKELKVSNIYYY